jgi:hypothetical protein
MTANLGLILLAAAVVAMVVGPIMMLQPSASQRRQEQLRSSAMALGLRVKIMSLPRQATDIDTPSALPMYCLPRSQAKIETAVTWLLLRGTYIHEAHFFAEWQWFGEGRASPSEQQWLHAHLSRLPESVAAVSSTPEGVCVYWSEAGGEKVLNGLAEVLRSYPNL